jgi:deoxyribose-phosphate aldolase
MTPAPTYESLAAIVQHTLLEPELTNAQVVDGLETAKRYGVAAVSVRACDADLAVRMLKGSSVRPGSIVSYPYGFQSTAVKLYEARDLLRRGITEIGVVVGASKLLSREFQQVQTELNQLVEACRGAAARLTVVLETALLTNEQKIIACTCCERAEVDFVATARGYTAPDLQLLRKHLPDETGIQVSGIATLDEALELQTLGVSRLATPATAEILAEWKRRVTPPTAT